MQKTQAEEYLVGGLSKSITRVLNYSKSIKIHWNVRGKFSEGIKFARALEATGLGLGAPSKVPHRVEAFPTEVPFAKWKRPCPMKD